MCGLTTLPPSCVDCLEIWDHQPTGTPRVCPGLFRDCFTFIYMLCKFYCFIAEYINNKVYIVNYCYMLRYIYIIFRESFLIYAQVIPHTGSSTHIGIAPTRHFQVLSIAYTASKITASMYCKLNSLTHCTTF